MGKYLDLIVKTVRFILDTFFPKKEKVVEEYKKDVEVALVEDATQLKKVWLPDDVKKVIAIHSLEPTMDQEFKTMLNDGVAWQFIEKEFVNFLLKKNYSLNKAIKKAEKVRLRLN